MDNKLFQTDAETAVLSILIKNEESIYNINGLRWFMFSSSPNQILFQEIEEFAESQTSVNAEILYASLESKGKLSKIGGKKHLEFLTNQNYKSENLKNYIDIVIASYKARKVIEITSEIVPETLNASTIDQVIRDTKRKLDEVGEHASSGGVSHVGDNIAEIHDEILSRTESPGIRGLSWGIADIDRISGGKSGGDYWIISGRPSMGKSSIMCSSVLTDALSGSSSLIFSKEMRKPQLVERFLSIDTQIPLTNIRQGYLNQKQINQIHESIKKIKNYPIYIDTNFNISDLYYIESTINKYQKLHDIKTVYIDYIQLLSEREDGQTAELGRISRMIRLLCNQNDICIIAFSQLNRGVEMRDNKRPLMSDLRQSGNLEEDADYVVGLYRDDYYNKETKEKGIMEFIFQKNRNGPVGAVPIGFEAETTRLYALK